MCLQLCCGSTSPSDRPPWPGSGDGDLPTSRTSSSGVMVAEARGHLVPLPGMSPWSLLVATPLDEFSLHCHHQRDGLSFMPGLSTVMTLLMAKVFPKSHKRFLGIREDSVPLVRCFFQCLGLVPSFFGMCLLHICCSSCQKFCVAAMWVLSGARRGDREVESCA